MTQLIDGQKIIDFCRRSSAPFDAYWQRIETALPRTMFFYMDKPESSVNARIECGGELALVYLHPQILPDDLPRALAHELTHAVHTRQRGAVNVYTTVPALAHLVSWIGSAITDPAVITDLHAAGFDQRAGLYPAAAAQFFSQCVGVSPDGNFALAAKYVTMARCWAIIKPINAAGYSLNMLKPSPGARTFAEKFETILTLTGLDTLGAQLEAARGMISVSPFSDVLQVKP